MNDHDDDVTTDVDPAWIAAIRAEAATTTSDGTSDALSPDATSTAGTAGDARRPEPTDRAGDEDWFDDELQWDAEATVGVSSGLIDRIRAEIDNDRGRGVAPPSAAFEPPQATTDAPAAAGNVTDAAPLVPPAVPPPSPPPAVPPPSSPLVPPVVPLPPGPPSPAPVDAPPTPAPVERAAPLAVGEEAASTTVRWEPRQRLAMTAPIKESAAIVDHSRHTGLDRTKIIIAVIVAVTVLLVVWLVSRAGGGADDPAPAGTVPAVSTPVTPPPDGADGAGAGG